MVKQISSLMTPVFRYVLVPWALVVAPMIVLAASIALAITRTPMALLAIALFALVLALMWKLVYPMWLCRRVCLTDTGLLVGPESHPRAIPFRDIADVTASRFTSPELITVRLTNGELVRFLGTLRARFGFSIHPIVGELQARMTRAHA